MSDLILLAALLEGPKHGWALKKLAGFVTGPSNMHNNLVYPLLGKFVAAGWVRRRSEPGQRGQTRAVYSLTLRGRRELLRRLNEFGEKRAASPSEFRLRVGLFKLLEPAARSRILAERGRCLAAREKHFLALQEGLKVAEASEWGSEVVGFLLAEVRAERRWITGLERKSGTRSGSAGKYGKSPGRCW